MSFDCSGSQSVVRSFGGSVGLPACLSVGLSVYLSMQLLLLGLLVSHEKLTTFII